MTDVVNTGHLYNPPDGNAPLTIRKRLRRAWNFVMGDRGGAVEADRWYSYRLAFGDPERPAFQFVLRQCPKCSALVQPTNESHHDAWHRGGSV